MITHEHDEWLLITEKASTGVHDIIKRCVINGFPKAWAKAEVLKLIDEIKKQFKEEEAPPELVDKTVRAMKYRFVGWYTFAMDLIEKEASKQRNGWLAKTYKDITGQEPKATKGFILESDGYTQGSLSNPREFVTTQERSGGQAYVEGYTKTVKDIMKRIGDERLTIKGKAGYSLSIRNLAEMTARHDAQVQELEKLTENDVKYVIASTHVNASARCAIWQGKLFKIDVTPGATFKQNIDLEYKPKPIEKVDGIDCYSLKDAMEHGFLGYNCRHRLVKYTKGMNMFRRYPEAQIQKERMLEMKQREMERNLLQARRELAMAVTPEEARALKKNVTKLRDLYYNYCRRNGLTIFEARTKIW